MDENILVDIIEMSDYITFTSNDASVTDEVDRNINEPTTSTFGPQYIILGESLTSNNQRKESAFEPQIAVESNKEDEILKILTAWRLPQLITIMKENEIDLEALQAMQKHDADELLREQTLGTQIKFIRNLSEWQRLQESNNIPATHKSCVCSKSNNLINSPINYQPATSTHDDLNKRLENSENVQLKYILEQTVQGRTLLSLYENKMNLSDSNWSIVVDLVVNHNHINKHYYTI